MNDRACQQPLKMFAIYNLKVLRCLQKYDIY